MHRRQPKKHIYHPKVEDDRTTLPSETEHDCETCSHKDDCQADANAHILVIGKTIENAREMVKILLGMTCEAITFVSYVGDKEIIATDSALYMLTTMDSLTRDFERTSRKSIMTHLLIYDAALDIPNISSIVGTSCPCIGFTKSNGQMTLTLNGKYLELISKYVDFNMEQSDEE